MAPMRIAAALLAAVLILSLPSCADAPPRSASVAPSGALALGDHEATLRGVRIWYRVAGRWDGRSAPVVYLAGGPGNNSYTFSRIAGPDLEADNLMVYYDQRGTGRSERPASGDYAISTLVDDIEALRVHLGVPRIALIAHSFGAILALEYAARYPDKAAAVVLAGALWNAPMSCREQTERLGQLQPDAHRILMSAGPLSDEDACGRLFRALPGRQMERFTEANMFPLPQTLELLNRTEAESGLRNTGELSSFVFRNGLPQYEFSGFDRLSAPVLVIAGGRDHAAGPRTLRALAERLRRGRLLVYPELGHWMFLDAPQGFARDVSEFLREVSDRE